MEEVMMMLPPPRLPISAMPYLSPSHTPRTLTAMTLSKTSIGYSVDGLDHAFDTGIEDEHIDAAEACDGGLEVALDVLRPRDVGDDVAGRSRRDLLRCALQRRLLVIHEQHPGAFTEEDSCGRKTDPARAARDH